LIKKEERKEREPITAPFFMGVTFAIASIDLVACGNLYSLLELHRAFVSPKHPLTLVPLLPRV
tara:strand:+ start:1263 stop:1451 length:189 start_codon:yes stop_codon:yes gene_type:complete